MDALGAVLTDWTAAHGRETGGELLGPLDAPGMDPIYALQLQGQHIDAMRPIDQP